MTKITAKQHATIQRNIEIALNTVMTMATDLAANCKPRNSVAEAMSAMAFFTKLPKGRQYAEHFNIVAMLVEKKAINVELFEFALIGTGFVADYDNRQSA